MERAVVSSVRMNRMGYDVSCCLVAVHLQIEFQKWKKDSVKNACDAYLNARKELGILLALNHDHIVPLLGISVVPLCLVLSLAPQGSLSDHLRYFQRSNMKLPAAVIRDVIVQVNFLPTWASLCQCKCRSFFISTFVSCSSL